MISSFRFDLYSQLALLFRCEECHNIQPCEVISTPLTEPDLKISLIRLFGQTHRADDKVYIGTMIRGSGSGNRVR